MENISECWVDLWLRAGKLLVVLQVAYLPTVGSHRFKFEIKSLLPYNHWYVPLSAQPIWAATT
jgi:hypothetical protein